MADTTTYLCWLDTEDPKTDTAWSCESYSMHDAAEQFAEYAFHHRGRWESGDLWDVLVTEDDPNVPVYRFTIAVEAVPCFAARKMGLAEPGEESSG